MEVSAVYAQTALVSADSKAAALYFDHVVPLFAQSVVDGFTSSEVKAGVLSVLTPERFLERLKTLYEPLNQERVLERLKTLAPDVLLSDGSLRMEYLTLLRHLADTQSMVAVLDQSMDAVLGLFRERFALGFRQFATERGRE
jgi:DNA-binding NarL/FixJ family response regulator